MCWPVQESGIRPSFGVVFGWYWLVFAFLGRGGAAEWNGVAKHKLADAPTKAWMGVTKGNISVQQSTHNRAVTTSGIRGPGGH